MNLRTTRHPTRHPLNATSRATVIRLLNDTLAVFLDLRLQVKQAHWNIRGGNMISLHELFDKFVEQLDETADEFAERATALGGCVSGCLPAIGNSSTLPSLSPDITGSFDLIELLAERYASVSSILIAGIEQAQTVKDEVTADLLIGAAYSIDKNLWLLEAHLEPEFSSEASVEDHPSDSTSH